MKHLHTTHSLAEIGYLKNLLEQSGIRCTVKNEQLAGAVGEIPPLECVPELWVLDDRELTRALEILAEATAQAPRGTPWRCGACGETNDREFAACWRCGRTDESE